MVSREVLVLVFQVRVLARQPSFAKASEWLPHCLLRFGTVMHYVYIIWSSKSSDFYFGYTEDLNKRIEEHNDGVSEATAPYAPWKLVWYAGFEHKRVAKDFERYLKTGSGKAFAYKRLLDTEKYK